jgi:hypothetical protein
MAQDFQDDEKGCSVLQMRKCSRETVNVAAIVPLFFNISNLKGKNIGASFYQPWNNQNSDRANCFLCHWYLLE